MHIPQKITAEYKTKSNNKEANEDNGKQEYWWVIKIIFTTHDQCWMADSPWNETWLPGQESDIGVTKLCNFR